MGLSASKSHRRHSETKEINSRKKNALAPRDPHDNGRHECPICFQNFNTINQSSCCHQNICTGCYEVISSKDICPFCNHEGFEARITVSAAIVTSDESIAKNSSTSATTSDKPKPADVYVPKCTAKDRKEIEDEILRMQSLFKQSEHSYIRNQNSSGNDTNTTSFSTSRLFGRFSALRNSSNDNQGGLGRSQSNNSDNIQISSIHNNNNHNNIGNNTNANNTNSNNSNNSMSSNNRPSLSALSSLSTPSGSLSFSPSSGGGSNSSNRRLPRILVDEDSNSDEERFVSTLRQSPRNNTNSNNNINNNNVVRMNPSGHLEHSDESSSSILRMLMSMQASGDPAALASMEELLIQEVMRQSLAESNNNGNNDNNDSNATQNPSNRSSNSNNSNSSHTNVANNEQMIAIDFDDEELALAIAMSLAAEQQEHSH